MINEVGILTGSTGVAHNGIFRGKNLGTISSLNEYLNFRTAHGINDKSYTDLYLGDYFKINDGTYNVQWMVAHFDYYYGKGDGGTMPRGVVLIPRTSCSESSMNSTNVTTGGYASSVPNTTTCPAIATKLQTVLGSYLLSFKALFSNTTNTSIASMAGANWKGASTNWAWTTTQCLLPTEIQIFGSTVVSSSLYDVGESYSKLAVFNFINNVEYERLGFWLRSVASSTDFAFSSNRGFASYASSSNSYVLRPLIYIG